MKHIALVVEGPGDREAVPVLLRKYLSETQQYQVGVGNPWTTNGRANLLKEGELERYVRGVSTVPEACAVLVVFDADDSQACQLGPECLERAENETKLPVCVSLAVREFENWIVASSESVFGTSSSLADPEGRGAKQAIREALAPQKYIKPVDQPRLTARIDFALARSACPSLDRFLQRVDHLVDCCGAP